MIVCADDYGFGGDINDAILELCALGKLSAVSCAAALGDCSRQVLEALRAHEGKVDIGLHLCLADQTLGVTDSTGTTAPTLPSYRKFVRQAVLRNIAPADIAAMAATQYAQFVEKAGRRPDFIDGHLHAHQLPGARAGVIKFVLTLPLEWRPYIRNTHLPSRELRKRRLPWLKAAAIGIFGARILRALRTAAISTNEGFAGIYDFQKCRRYPQYLPRFVECLSGPNGILVVHPGNREEWRRREFAALRDFSFPAETPNRFRRNI